MIKEIKKGKSRGFSLVELLIVITIIGILSTIVLSSVSNGRARAYDSKVKQQLVSFRTAAEIYFINQLPNTYGVSNICTSGIFVDVDPVNGAPGTYLSVANLPVGTQLECGANGDTFAVKATLYSGSQYWCVDNSGDAKIISGPIGSSVTSCP